MRIHLRGSRREDGAVAIMVAFLAPILVVLVAFTTDFGMAYAQRQALATGADSAALAVIHTEYNTQLTSLTRTCDSARVDDAVLAKSIAVAQINANAPFGATIPASDVTATLSCESGGTVLQVKVTVNRSITPIFGGVVSASPQHIDRTAVAAMGVVNQVVGLEPIALCNKQAQAIIDLAGPGPIYTNQVVPLDKDWGAGSTCGNVDSAGNWGWITFPTQANGESGLGTMVTTGYSGLLTIDNSTTPPSYTLNGLPGNKANGTPVQTGLQSIMDKSVTFPVFDSGTTSGNGSTATYRVIGFLSAVICGYNGGNKTVTGLCYDSTKPMTTNSMQIVYVAYTPVGSVGEVCKIGSACAFNAYVTSLLG
jgi:Flp pilus assembly protein TadG